MILKNIKTNLVNHFLKVEEEFIETAIVNSFKKRLFELDTTDLKLINSNFKLTNKTNYAFDAHLKLINSLLYYCINDFNLCDFKTELLEAFEIFENQLHYRFDSQLGSFDTQLSLVDLCEILEAIHVEYLNSEFFISNSIVKRKKSKHHLRENGAVYTLNCISREIVEKTIERCVLDNKSAETITCLDFGCGTGRFYLEALNLLVTKYGLSTNNIVLDNLYAIDVDNVAIKILKIKVISLLSKVTLESITAVSKNILCRNGLIPTSTLMPEIDNGIDFYTDFPLINNKGGFDCVFSNPPYYLLKANKKDNKPELAAYHNALQKKLNTEINFFKNSGIYRYSIEGMLNYYQLAIERIINLTKPNGQIGIICPSTLFGDLTSSKLRKHILNFHKLHFIRFYPESALLFENVAQSTAIFFIQTKSVTDNVVIEIGNNVFNISKDLIKSSFPINNEIPPIDKFGWKILEKLSKFSKVKDIPFIRNKRGELDLTLFKTHITKENTGWRLVRGNMIADNKIIDKNLEYVEIDSFLEKKSNDFKINDFNKKRLVCQQISNIDSLNRLKFVFSEPNDIIGNSCNYIVSTREEKDLKKLYLILNSDLLNWRFKVSSSNNHVNNYEIDDLPIVDLDKIDLLDLSEDINEKICQLYGLTGKETEYIFNKNKKSTSKNIYEETI